MSAVMLQGAMFGKATGLTGIMGFAFLGAFEVGSSFVPSARATLTFLAMVGGVLIAAWYVAIGLKLLRK